MTITETDPFENEQEEEDSEQLFTNAHMIATLAVRGVFLGN